MGFDPYNHFLKIQKSIETPSCKMRTHLGVWRFISSHSPTLLEAWNVIPRLHSWPTPSQAFALVISPKLGSRHLPTSYDSPTYFPPTTYLFTYLTTYFILPTNLYISLLDLLPMIYLPTYLPTYLLWPTYLIIYFLLPTYQPTYLPTYQLTHLLTYLPTSYFMPIKIFPLNYLLLPTTYLST